MPTNTNQTRLVTPFAQANAFAMQHGIFMGIYLILTLAALVNGMVNPTLSLVSTALIVAYPFVIGRLTFSFRRTVAPTERFTIFRGFMYALFTMLYAAIWTACIAYLYMRFFDNGYFVNTLLTAFSNPQMQELLKTNPAIADLETQSGMSLTDIIRQMQNIAPSYYAEMILYMNIMFAPLTALIIGLCTMRNQPKPMQHEP